MLLQVSYEFPIHVPIQACQQVLVVWPLSQSLYALGRGLLHQGFFNFPPRVLDADLVLKHEIRGRPSPMLKLSGLPFPFQEVGDGSRQGTLHGVPGMVFGTLVLVDVGPGLLEVRDLVSWPGMV